MATAESQETVCATMALGESSALKVWTELLCLCTVCPYIVCIYYASPDLRLVGSGEESGDSHVTGIVVGVVVGVLVLVTVVTVVTVLLVWKRREVKRVLSEQRKRFQIFGEQYSLPPTPVHGSTAYPLHQYMAVQPTPYTST